MTPRKAPRATALDKLMFLAQPVHDGQCRCVITLDGRLDGARMARAAELSLRAAPVLACGYAVRPWRSRWEPICPPGSALAFSRVESDDRQGEIDRFQAEPMDPARGPQAAVRFIRSDRDVLCVKLDHIVADATGVLDYVRMLNRLYRRLRIEPEYVPTGSAAEDRGLGQVVRGAGPRALVRGCFHFRYPRSPWGFPRAGSGRTGRAFPLLRIDAERVARMKAYGREKGASLSDVLIAAFYRALIDVLDPPAGARLPVELTIDLRRHLPSGRTSAICDLAGAYFPLIPHISGAPFDRTLGDVRAAVAEAQAGYAWLGAVVFMGLLSLFPTAAYAPYGRRVVERRASSGTAYPIFSNLGVIDPSIFDFGDAAAADLGMFSPVMFPPDFPITVYSFRDRMSITSSFCPTAADPRLVDRFFSRFTAELPG